MVKRYNMTSNGFSLDYDIREDIGIKHIATRKKFIKDIASLKTLYERQKSDCKLNIECYITVLDIMPLSFDPVTLSGTIGSMHPHAMVWKHLHDKTWECNECGRKIEGNCFRCDKCNEDWCPHCFNGQPKYCYDVFLSHRQINGGDTCQSIKLQLENIDPTLKIFLGK
jgi:hypothetical protein